MPAGPQASRSAGLLYSILARYPEVARLVFHPHGGELTFTFLVRGSLAEPEWQGLLERIRIAQDALSWLDRWDIDRSRWRATPVAGITTLEWTRDVATLTLSEVEVVVTLLRDLLGERLVVDTSDRMLDEEQRLQEEMIEEMLEDVRAERQTRGVLGFRDGGRVVVFHRS